MTHFIKRTNAGPTHSSEHRARGTGHGAMAAGLIVLSALAVTSVFTLGTPSPDWRVFLILYACATIWWAGAIRKRTSLTFPATVGIAVVLRILFAVSPPALSADAYRYLWDGRVSFHGLSPYAEAPNSERLAYLRTDWHSEVNHPEIAAIYPPLAQLFFLIPPLFEPQELLAWRLFLLLADLVTIVLLYRERPCTAFAWMSCPLVLVEGFWSAHVEMVMIPLLLAAARRARDSKPVSSGIWAGLASGVKFVPLAAAPALLFFTRARSRWLAAMLTVLGVPFLFFAGRPLMPGLHDYAVRWSFNSPIYSFLLSLVERSQLAELIKQLWTSIKDPLQLESISDRVYRQLYPPMLTRVLLGMLILVLILIVTRRSATLLHAILRSIGVLLLFSPAIHPWYWLTALPFALLTGSRAWTLLALASPASYLLYEDADHGTLVLCLSYGVPLLVGLWDSGLRARVIRRWIAFRGDSSS